jgi:Uma2 family endonuclease
MSHATETTVGGWTAVDLVKRFGAIPLDRVVMIPEPGTATEQDVVELDAHHDRLCELVDGALIQKTVSIYESYLASKLMSAVFGFVHANRLGIALGVSGPYRLAPGLVRTPDASFVSWGRLPRHEVPREPIPDLVPDLAVEVISRYNTREEMERKLRDYFTAGVRLVWYVYHTPRREVWVYVSPTEYSVVREDQTLDGGAVLPGFRLSLADLFAEPADPRPRPRP